MTDMLKKRNISISGFTLIEILIVIAILGILAAIAVPSYNEYILKAKLPEAFNMLSEGRVKMEQLFQDNRRYATVVDGVVCPPAVATTLDDGAKYFTISCAVVAKTAATDESYTITATGVAGSPTANFAYTINNLNVRTTTSTYWGNTSTTCWVSNPSGGCY
ncbi:MAG: type IV pilin protein [Rhodocyclaceae bacterium]|nr:type IV pilin protein [Rhodocyclaceae bacterium]